MGFFDKLTQRVREVVNQSDSISRPQKSPEQLLIGLVEGWIREACSGQRPPDLAPRLVDLIRIHHPNINAKHPSGDTPVMMLIKGWTALQSILWEERADEINKCLKILLDHGADVDCPDLFWDTPLLRLVKGTLELADKRHETIIICERPLPPDLRTTPKYPRQIKDIIEVLLNYGADLQAEDSQGKTAFDYAAACGYQEAADVLLIKSLDPRVERELERMIISKEATQALIKHCSGATPLNPAQIHGLLEGGADPNARDEVGYHVLANVVGHPCSNTNLNDALEAARLLLQYGADPNAPAFKDEGPYGLGAQEESCLFFPVCSYRNAEEAIRLTRLLLDRGATIQPSVNPYFSVLKSSLSLSDQERFLMNHGVQIVPGVVSYSSVCQRIPSDIAKIVKFLIDLGIEPNTRKQLGLYPVDMAEELSLEEAAGLLRAVKDGK